ncbi:MAG: thioredoxin family protein [Paracoccus sp. (in: a-proteobacteria)]|jgi:peroxiredoxin|uniref:thioredoxin family protein n=1 Tax=unclassified Paracoccus (in: a-proteobacteria) TaxID=2688777 RepID=UPI000C4103B0|nr:MULTISPECIES: thioredoxin family protein [unclassified Paracoccus (in: a-proteobacteria)]MAN57075.1 thioredoxin family protein [Paracoccus sp. (in: a-proteobacteria)]MBA48768.1 thioredoxin family protein [Paracoccus sp. (in: a-proteobacteria)]MCS5603415.1 thioredoxin family protein [Paracoccus sp. (in: a-proteobacteria)]MDB2490347.1 thioredoxin family protein [Paracoccus sp. (in: a-proteobacteria)]MDB2551293.1 thioredoxin family protein [Paracoccus sp. (in: a-proteobacteria)]|tara:strand:+ start:7238 stop:7792 length:555 start_codon:yes stop_codon:yes gene_type:complete
MAVSPPVCDFGAPWHDFTLPDPDGKAVSLADIEGSKGTLVMFICNHCPYVQAVLDRIVRDAKEMQAAGIGVVAISANDVVEYPGDGPKQMKAEAEKHGFSFPYLYDKSQDTARAYGAECTPDFFGYNADGRLQYRGRLDSSTRQAGPADAKRELRDAMMMIAKTGKGPVNQVPSMGCSIKWKSA